MSSQSLVTKRGQPRARGDERANYIRGWEAEGFPIGGDGGGHSVVKAPALLAQEVFAAHEAWRVIVRVRVGSPFGQIIQWAKGPLPYIKDLTRLADAHPFDGVCNKRALLQDISPPTALERSKGNWEAVIRELGGPGLSASLAELTAAYDAHIFPSTTQPSTRLKNWANWSLVVTWAIVRKAVHMLLPMSRDTLKAITWDLITFGASRSQVAAVWCAIQARHNAFGLEPPLCKPREFTTWMRALEHVMGRPLALKLPIHRSVVVWLLRFRPDSIADHRDRLLTILATLTCLRVSEAAELTVCDLWFDYFTGMGVPGFEGTCAVFVRTRKNDSIRKGHFPALGRSRDPGLDVVRQLTVWLQWTGLCVQPGCPKRLRRQARCPVCPPLFPKTCKTAGGRTGPTWDPIPPQRASAAIKRMVGIAGCDTRRFSGVSARKGGLSTAIEAGVEEVILYLQSGHGPERAARNYMHLREPGRLLQTFEAFGL